VILRFAVSDTGIGVGPGDRERVFGVFRQVDSPITRRTGGSGLGLAISRQLTELMGGQIGLDSVEGVGSRFWVRLPVDVLTWSEPGAGALTGRRALVADSRPEDRALARRYLSDAGLAVEETRDAGSALALLRAAATGGTPYELAVVALDLGTDPGAAESSAHGEAEAVSLAHAILTDPLLQATSVVVVVTPGRARFAWPAAAGERAVQSITRPLSRRRLLAAVENALGSGECPGEPREGTQDVAALPGGARILVAEDDEVSRQVAMLVLRQAGHEVETVDDGGQAVRAVLAGGYDLVFMDCQLPVLDGLAATAEIRRREDVRIPIIAMTAAAMPEDRIRCLEAGMDDHLAKPVDWTRVLARIPEWAAYAGLPPELAGLSAEALAEVAQAYLATARRTFEDLRQAARAGDLPEVAALAHRLRGSCATVGAVREAGLCRRVEDLARTGAVEHEALEELNELLKETPQWMNAP
jgi:two-component system sensor histidine kinase/response regulator